jgi:hypothetical protein
MSVTPAALLAAATVLQAQPGEFANIRSLGRALIEYNDGVTHAVAAYYHSQLHHESAWLLVEVGFASPRSLTIRRDALELVTPSGRVVPLATQRRWRQDSARARALLQQACTSRHQVRPYFREINGSELLRFFTRPENGDTVLDAGQVAPDQVLFGDLMFESPTGAWERGSYALNLRHDRGTASLPIELR